MHHWAALALVSTETRNQNSLWSFSFSSMPDGHFKHKLATKNGTILAHGQQIVKKFFDATNARQAINTFHFLSSSSLHLYIIRLCLGLLFFSSFSIYFFSVSFCTKFWYSFVPTLDSPFWHFIRAFQVWKSVGVKRQKVCTRFTFFFQRSHSRQKPYNGLRRSK